MLFEKLAMQSMTTYCPPPHPPETCASASFSLSPCWIALSCKNNLAAGLVIVIHHPTTDMFRVGDKKWT